MKTKTNVKAGGYLGDLADEIKEGIENLFAGNAKKAAQIPLDG